MSGSTLGSAHGPAAPGPAWPAPSAAAPRGARSGADGTAFVGRTRELAELRGLLPSARALTLCGAGGIGKTRLALRLAADASAGRSDGTALVNLADLSRPDLVVARTAAAVGVAEEPERPLAQTLVGALRYRDVIIVLDNCEHLIEAAARLCQQILAACPAVRIIATSREPLRVAAETIWQVPPLTLPAADDASPRDLLRSDAVRLFAERAAAAAPGFTITAANRAAVTAICRALDGLPLAIELAAAWAGVLSADQIAALLADRFRLLTADGLARPRRQRTLRAAIDWSYALLSPPEKVLLRRLSVLAGWHLEMAEQVCADPAGRATPDGLAAPAILDLLTGLADKSLVITEIARPGRVRYQMLDSIRKYAAERLAEAGERTEVAGRLRDYTLAEVERLHRLGMARVAAPWSDRVDVFRLFDEEGGNLRQVLDWCLADRDAETGLRICVAAGPCWIVQGSYAEAAAWLDSFLGPAAAGPPGGTTAAAGPAPELPAAVLGPALVTRAQIAAPTSPDQAEQWALAGLRLCQRTGDEFWAASALNVASQTALHGGNARAATERGRAALDIARRCGDRWNEAYALGTLATVAAVGGEVLTARRHAETALAVMRAIDQQWGVARALLGLGDLARITGDTAIASQRYAGALDILREVNARPEIARCLAGLGRTCTAQGEFTAARRYLAESLELSVSTGSRVGVVRAIEGLAMLASAQDDHDRAIRLASAAATLRAADGLPPSAGSRARHILDRAAPLGASAIDDLWAAGAALTTEQATRLALGPVPPAARRPGPAARASTLRTGSDGSGQLTARERDVVALLVQGGTNRQIAARLSISESTVARHIANITGKLGLTSRAQVTAWALNGGPAGRPSWS
jgi:predicted ATPase/DNA-binding CsgD family transcriptional regulator